MASRRDNLIKQFADRTRQEPRTVRRPRVGRAPGGLTSPALRGKNRKTGRTLY